jgi:hypothetical protein
VSFICKAAGAGQFAQISAAGDLSSAGHVNFDLLAGTITQATTFTGFIKSLGNGWFQVSALVPATATGSGTIRLAIVETGTSARIAATTGAGRALAVWAAQCDTGSFPTSFALPPFNTAGPVTRQPDVATAPWASVAPGGKCTVLLAGKISGVGDPFPHYMAISDGSASNRITLYSNTGSLGVNRAVVSGGVTQLDQLTGASVVVADGFRVGLTWTGNRIAVSVNGGDPLWNSIGTPPVNLSQFHIFNRGGLDRPQSGRVTVCRVLPYALSDAALQAAVNALPVPV